MPDLTVAGAGCCALCLERLAASYSVGTAVALTGNPEKLCLATGAAAGAAPAAAPAPPPPADAGGGRWLWVVLVAVAVVLVAILIVRGRSA
jgi:hypothetical protein